MGRRMKSIGNLVRRNYIAAKLSYSARTIVAVQRSLTL